MSRTVDIFELSRTRRTIEGEATLTDMPQLESALEGETREASARLTGLVSIVLTMMCSASL